MEATDLDSGKNGKISYEFIPSTASGLFKINDSNGDVTLHGTLDFENESSYTLTALAKDSGSPRLNSTAVLKIFVIDINEKPSVKCVGSCVHNTSKGRSAV